MNDFTSKLEEARQKLPLKTLMEKHGRGPSNGNWKEFPKCPYCDGDQCAGIYSRGQRDLFKCHRDGCRSGTSDLQSAWDEIAFLAFELNVDRRQATRAWLEQACVRIEREQSSPDQKPSGDKHQTGDDISSTVVLHENADVTSKSPLQAFVERASLSNADRQELRVKRGLSDEMIDGAGFLTNDHSNLTTLNALAIDYPEWELVKSGLYKRSGNICKPSGQFYGYGVVGKKKKLPAELLESREYDDVDDNEFVWAHKETGLCNPILVPYYNLSRELIGIRPHKGFPKGQKPHLYLAGGRLAPQRCDRAIITEGEMKGNAVQDVCKDLAVAAVPGITQVKNLHVWSEILAWLKRIGAQLVVFLFDNEEHGDPNLSSFRPQLEDRYQAEIWARVGAVRLDREGYDARVGHLPDELRDKNGKIDCDSLVAAMLQAGKPRSEIRSVFEKVFQNSIPASDLDKAKLFEPAAMRIIKDRVAVRTYEPALPWGGQAERKLAGELRKLAAGELREWAWRIIPLAEAYEAVLGWLYELKISEQHRDRLLVELHEVEGSSQMLFLKLALKGTPNRVAPFRVEPYFVLVKPDGGRDRLLQLVNLRGERTGLVALDENSFTAPRDWRRWLARMGNYGWEKGEGPLQALQRDINFVLARREVMQLVCYGCERPGALWFVDDCAYAEDGTLVLPDAQGIYWYQGRGYTFLRDQEDIPRGEEAQSFRLKSPPRMQPELGVVFDQSGKLRLEAGAKDDPAALRELLGNFIIHLIDSYGGYDGLMLIASTVAYFGGPEIYKRRGEFPGIWITGEKGSGKSYTAKWSVAIHGFTELEAGLSFKTSSAVGAQIAMGQYANIPAWGDEYKENELRDANVKGVIHGGFNREVPSKWSSDGRVRTIRTNFLVTGESTCSTAATMSRFISTVASRERRRGSEEEQLNRLNWLQDHRKLFFAIGRAVLQQRAEFAARLIEHLSIWERLPELTHTDPRSRFSYGVSYAAFMALNEIIPVYTGNDCTKFRNWLIEKAQASTREISDRVELNQFWTTILSMHANGLFGKTPEEIGRFFKVVENKRAAPRFSERQAKDAMEDSRRALKVPKLAMQPGPVIALMNNYIRNQGGPLPPSQSDLQAQMRERAYFVSAASRQGHQLKFGRGAKNNSYCWCIDLAQFDHLGLREVSDEDWIASFYRDGNPDNGMLPIDQWVDPRKGELFSIVGALEDHN
jgi:hypothetical protein